MAPAGDFSRGSVGSNIMQQALPLLAAEIVHLLYNIVDRIYIGHLPGADAMALTGLGVTFPLVALVGAFTRLIGTGGAPLFSIARGAGDTDRAARLQGTAAAWLALLSVFVFVFCMAFRRPILFLFGAGESSYAYADRYLRIYLWGTAFTMISTGMNGFINAQGRPKVGMMTVALGAVLNLILDPLFIFVFKMSIEGAALATVISQGASCAWVVLFLCGKKALIPIRRADLRLRPRMAGEICRLGVSGFIMSATNCLTQAACNAVLQARGGENWVGVMTVLHSIREVLSLPVNCISTGAQPFIGFNYGAKAMERVKKGIRFTFFAGGASTMAAWLSVELFSGAYVRLFTDNAAILQEAPDALKAYFFAFVFMAFQMTGQSTFTALGRSKQAVFFSLLRKAFIVTPLTFLLPYIITPPVYGVFWAEPVSNVIGGLACFITMMATVYFRLKDPHGEIGAQAS
ncbi:MAG: MATE family efflux transporter [Clostridia bacterium]|nr:MATE family efflux transporter [Clostridia bacterium]